MIVQCGKEYLDCWFCGRKTAPFLVEYLKKCGVVIEKFIPGEGVSYQSFPDTIYISPESVELHKEIRWKYDLDCYNRTNEYFKWREKNSYGRYYYEELYKGEFAGFK
jgi:hypothetical protein